jgi:transcriptional regulator GlxA family with amidase domain
VLPRRFPAHVGTTPALWLRTARVRRAQQLLETATWSVDAIAAKVGYRSSAVRREHFRAILGTAPLAFRRAFGGGRPLRNPRINPAEIRARSGT